MLDGFSIYGYRSFGASGVQIANLSRLNIFIGKNNCGKSNILRFLKLVSNSTPGPLSKAKSTLDPNLDFNLIDSTKQLLFGIQLKKSGFTSSAYKRIQDIFNSASPTFGERLGNDLWIYYSMAESGQTAPARIEDLAGDLRKKFNLGESKYSYQ